MLDKAMHVQRGGGGGWHKVCHKGGGGYCWLLVLAGVIFC